MKPFLLTHKERKSAYCSFCDGERSMSRRIMNHRAFLIMTLLTGGLWGAVWLTMWLSRRRSPWRCRSCRRSVRWDASPDFHPAVTPAGSTPEAEEIVGAGVAAEGNPTGDGLAYRLSPRTPRRFRDESV